MNLLQIYLLLEKYFKFIILKLFLLIIMTYINR